MGNYNLICVQTLVQLGLYAMGRDPKVFPRPEQYQPSRWLKTQVHYFRSLGFGFGPRQCLGRRIAEAEMQLFLIHVRKPKEKSIFFRPHLKHFNSFIDYSPFSFRCLRTSGWRNSVMWTFRAPLSSSSYLTSPSF